MDLVHEEVESIFSTPWVARVGIFLGVFLLSFDGILLIRVEELNSDILDTIFWKYFFYTLFSTPMTIRLIGGLSQLPQEFEWEGSRYMWIGTVLEIMYSVTACIALIYAEPAIVSFLLGLAPVWAGGLGAFVLGEKLQLHTMVAILVCLMAMGFCFLGKMVQDNESESRYSSGDRNAGTISGLLGGIMIAAATINYKLGPRTGHGSDRMLLVVPIGGFVIFFGILLASFCGAGSISSPSAEALGWSFVNGVIGATFNFIYVKVSMHLSSVEVTLFLLLEVVFYPAWAWLFIPRSSSWTSVATLSIVLVNLVGYVWWDHKLEDEVAEFTSASDLIKEKQDLGPRPIPTWWRPSRTPGGPPAPGQRPLRGPVSL